MARSRVRAGVFDARDRATKRRRDQRRRDLGPPIPPHEKLREWVAEYVGSVSLEDAERLDLKGYLRDTGRFEVPAPERLRVLAAALEDAVQHEGVMRAWSVLDRVYQMGLRMEPRNASLHASRGISAAELAIVADDGAARLFAIARSELAEAAARDPSDAEIAYAGGYVSYMDPSREVTEALEQFDRTLALDSRHPWARLYRAHCLHDLERWQEAAKAYSAVPMADFIGFSSWRMDLLVEQRAWCRLMSGDHAGALEEFERILARYEKQPHLAYWHVHSHLENAASMAFPQLRDRVAALDNVLRTMPAPPS